MASLAGVPSVMGEGSFVAGARNGRWGTAQYVPHRGMSQVSSVSCRAAGYCTAAGYSEVGINIQAYAVAERGGRWGVPVEVPGIARLLRAAQANRSEVVAVSCWSPGDCGACGDYWSNSTGHAQVFVVSRCPARQP